VRVQRTGFVLDILEFLEMPHAFFPMHLLVYYLIADGRVFVHDDNIINC